MVTDYDCWREDEAAVTVEEVVSRLNQNASMARGIIGRVAAQAWGARDCPCAGALRNAILTERSLIPRETRDRLRLLLGPSFG